MDNNFNYDYSYSQPPKHVSGKAIASMICGILSIPANCGYIIPGTILAIVGLILAIVAKKEPNIKNPGMANAGMVCSIISLVLAVAVVVILLLIMVLGLSEAYVGY